ncbi:fungal-specific transcription factor domain-containing protein [Truncatella angustata]|uniref:Fungal-specific transcription factor domain-containing protein n=1 Tax=Truncatella angustata TaxID=152316 RepID=A0A9P8UJE0_9PEZI|nr:fungal-specific transcription factor domain-containing protein [Truncatella angustata]KAH6653261.1 fungal-specific transcription factor domain-containing protein [Truncatella angustata]
MKARKGCWTCHARKVQCDGARPVCEKCVRGRRECQGYKTRLSWPREGDKKRAITGYAPPVAVYPTPEAKHFFINTTWQDIKLHRHVYLQKQSLHLIRPTSPWCQTTVAVNHLDLVHYFLDSAYLSLVTFGANTTTQVRDTLMRMALARDTTPGLALFYALLAFSSLRRNGIHQQAIQFKVLALQFLSASARGGGPLDSTAAIQHVAASMLLSAFEILLPSESSGEWLWYLLGAMEIIQATRLEDQLQDGDIAYLLEWVYYHNALSRFSMHHWRHKSLSPDRDSPNDSTTRGRQYSYITKHRQLWPSPNPAYAILNLLSEICDTLLDPRDPRTQTEAYKSRVKALEQRVESPIIIPDSTTPEDDSIAAAKRYHLATQIYFARASQDPWEPPSARLDSLVDRAFIPHVGSTSCVHFFPLFILACEARTDERRAIVLEILDQSESRTRIRSMKGLKSVILSIWVQQDLHADNDLLTSYYGIMSTVISSGNALPSFV